MYHYFVSLFWVFIKSLPTRILSPQADHVGFVLEFGSDALLAGHLAGLDICKYEVACGFSFGIIINHFELPSTA